MSPPTERWADGPTVLGSIWRYRWLVLAATVLMGVGGYLLAQTQEEVYEAASVMYLADPETAGVFDQTGRTELDRYLPQQAERATSSAVIDAAAELLDTSPEALGDVEASADLELATVTVTAPGPSGDDAAAVANAVVAAYQADIEAAQLDRAGRAISELEVAATELEEQIGELQATITPGAIVDPTVSGQLGVLSQRLAEIDALRQQLEVDARLYGSGVEFIEEAEAPSAPIAPRPRLTAVGLALVGALLSSALAYWLAGRGSQVASRNDPAAILGVPLLGVLPTYDVADHATLRVRTTLDAQTTEAYRFVYSSLEATLRGLGASSVMVTSANPNVGKTETSLQLAATAQRRSQRVLLIDADLRMHGLTNFLRAEQSPGLSDLAFQTQLRPSSLVGRYPMGDHGELSVLTSGQTDTDSRRHLSETWFGRAFEELVQTHDLTIVDSPPLLAVADTSMIAGYTDAVVLVVREGSDLDELERVRQRLQFVRQRLVGYIYLSPNALDDTAFDYGLVRTKGSAPRSSPPPQPDWPLARSASDLSLREAAGQPNPAWRNEGTARNPSSTPAEAPRGANGRPVGRPEHSPPPAERSEPPSSRPQNVFWDALEHNPLDDRPEPEARD